LKIFCKRTYFETNTNFFEINGKGYGEKYIKWQKNHLYEVRPATNFEMELGIIYYAETERNDMGQTVWSPIIQKTLDKYFHNIETLRDQKINQILQ